jgi:hypothetical protein
LENPAPPYKVQKITINSQMIEQCLNMEGVEKRRRKAHHHRTIRIFGS